MHPAIADYVRELRPGLAPVVSSHLRLEIADAAVAVAVKWTGGRGVLALGPVRLYSIHEHPHEEFPPTLSVLHLGPLPGATVEETRRLTQDGAGFCAGTASLVHPALPTGRVEADAMTMLPEAAVGVLTLLVA